MELCLQGTDYLNLKTQKGAIIRESHYDPSHKILQINVAIKK